MDDIASVVVGPAHEVGVWRGPAQRPWLVRIAHGAGFGNQWDLARLPLEPAAEADATVPAPRRDAPPVQAENGLPARAHRMWWLPGAHDL